MQRAVFPWRESGASYAWFGGGGVQCACVGVNVSRIWNMLYVSVVFKIGLTE